MGGVLFDESLALFLFPSQSLLFSSLKSRSSSTTYRFIGSEEESKHSEIQSIAMFKPTKDLNLVGVLKEAIINLSPRNGKPILSIMLLLFPFNLMQTAIIKLNPFPLNLDMASLLPFPLPATIEPGKSPLEVELVGEVLHWLSATVVFSSLSMAYIGKPSEFFPTIRRKWRRILITSFYGHAIGTACSFVVLAPTYISIHIGEQTNNEPTLSVAMIMVSAFVLMVIGLVILVFAILADQLSIVVSTVEEGCYGFAAVRRCGEIIRGRKVQAFILTALLLLVDQVLMVVADAVNRGARKEETSVSGIAVGALVNASVSLAVQLLWCSTYCVLYLEWRKRKHEKQYE